MITADAVMRIYGEPIGKAPTKQVQPTRTSINLTASQRKQIKEHLVSIDFVNKDGAYNDLAADFGIKLNTVYYYAKQAKKELSEQHQIN